MREKGEEEFGLMGRVDPVSHRAVAIKGGEADGPVHMWHFVSIFSHVRIIVLEYTVEYISVVQSFIPSWASSPCFL